MKSLYGKYCYNGCKYIVSSLLHSSCDYIFHQSSKRTNGETNMGSEKYRDFIDKNGGWI